MRLPTHRSVDHNTINGKVLSEREMLKFPSHIIMAGKTRHDIVMVKMVKLYYFPCCINSNCFSFSWKENIFQVKWKMVKLNARCHGVLNCHSKKFHLWCSSRDRHHYLSLQRFILFLCAPPGSCTSQLSELKGDVLGTTTLAHLKF